MRARHAREIRGGIQLARDVMAGRRMRPRGLVPFGFAGAPSMPLWQQAYMHELTAMVHDGRIKPPRGTGGIGGGR